MQCRINDQIELKKLGSYVTVIQEDTYSLHTLIPTNIAEK